MRITTAHAFPIASLVKINGEATALGKYTPVFSLVRATAISPSSSYEDRRPSFSSVEGETGGHRTPGFPGFDENARLTPSDSPDSISPHCLKVLAAIPRPFHHRHYRYHRRVYVVQAANMSAELVFNQPCPSIRFRRRVFRFEANHQTVDLIARLFLRRELHRPRRRINYH